LAVVDGTNPADEVRKLKTRRDWAMRELILDYRALVLCEMADSTQCSYERNLKRIENGLGTMFNRSRPLMSSRRSSA
jgi:hypothetical protein